MHWVKMASQFKMATQIVVYLIKMSILSVSITNREIFDLVD